jgi:hypothetical protein
MKHPSFASRIILPLLLAGAFSAPCRLSAQTAVPAGALGTVEYEVRYKIMGIDTKVAVATISLENGTWEGRPALHSHSVIRANSVFKLFLNAEYVTDAYITPDGKEPLYYINPTRKGKKEGKFECSYDYKEGTIRSEYVRPPADPVVGTYSLDGNTMDLLSLLFSIRFNDIAPGESRPMNLLMSGDCIAATLTCQGIDKDRYPGVETKRLHLKMTGRGLMENGSGDEITVWCTTDSSHRLLGLETFLNSNPMVVSVQ